MNSLAGVSIESMAFAASARAIFDAQIFTRHVTKTWHLEPFSADLTTAASRLITWLTAHEPATTFRLELTWDAPLVHLEVTDPGVSLPDPFVVKADAELAVDLLTPPIVEWGAHLDSRGRRLWITLHTAGFGISTDNGAVRL
jgi:hypothetical protein